jgi:hypothetical protein
MKVKNKLPSPSDTGVKWDSPDRFFYKGKMYEIDVHGKVKEVKPDGH